MREEERPSLIRVKIDHRLARAQQAGHEQGARRRRWARTRCARRRRSSAGIPTSTSSCPTGSTSTSTRRRAAPRCRRSGSSASRPGATATPSWPSSGTPRGPGKPLPGLREALSNIDWGKDKLATRSAGQQAMTAFSPTTCRRWSAARPTSASRPRPSSPAATSSPTPPRSPTRNVFFGVREHGMGGVVNGMAGHGGILRPVRLDLPAVRRLHARLDPPVGADGPRGRVGLHPRLGRPRRGRPDPPAGRAPGGAAGDPAPRRHPARRRQRDRRGVARRSSRTSTGRRR